MAPVVELSPETFKRLQAHAIPLVDTIESVIMRLVDEFETKKQEPKSSATSGTFGVREFNPNTPPDLTHAKILGFSFDGQEPARGMDNWNGLLNTAVRAAKEKAKSMDEFKAVMNVNYVEGNKQDEGYKYLPDTGISVQGQDANGAWRGACYIAQQLSCPLVVKFAWREKEGAAFPGITGQMTV